MKRVTDIFDNVKLIPESYENCLAIWCKKCSYFGDREKCISLYKMDQEG